MKAAVQQVRLCPALDETVHWKPPFLLHPGSANGNSIVGNWSMALSCATKKSPHSIRLYLLLFIVGGFPPWMTIASIGSVATKSWLLLLLLLLLVYWFWIPAPFNHIIVRRGGRRFGWAHYKNECSYLTYAFAIHSTGSSPSLGLAPFISSSGRIEPNMASQVSVSSRPLHCGWCRWWSS